MRCAVSDRNLHLRKRRLQSTRSWPTKLKNRVRSWGRLNTIDRNVVRDVDAKLRKQQGFATRSCNKRLTRFRRRLRLRRIPVCVSLLCPLLAILCWSPPPPLNSMNRDIPTEAPVEEYEEEDEEMEEVEDVGELGSGVGAFLAPPRKKMVKKTYLKKALGKGVSAEAETRASVSGPNRFNAGCSSETEGTAHAPRLSFSCHWVFLHSKWVHFEPSPSLCKPGGAEPRTVGTRVTGPPTFSLFRSCVQGSWQRCGGALSSWTRCCWRSF